MRPAGELVRRALELVEEMIAPGVTTLEIDRAVEELFVGAGGVPAFKGYPASTSGTPPFPGTVCASLNEEVVHGIPSAERRLSEGDIIAVDVGVQLGGFFGDAARSFAVGDVSRKNRRLLQAGADALAAAVAQMQAGAPLSRVSRAIQQVAEAGSFSVVEKFVGHGIGRAMHEPPQVPNFVSRGFPPRRQKLEPGLVLAIEPMINAGGPDVTVLADGWTAVTKDRSRSVHFEDSVAVGPEGPIVLTA